MLPFDVNSISLNLSEKQLLKLYFRPTMDDFLFAFCSCPNFLDLCQIKYYK